MNPNSVRQSLVLAVTFCEPAVGHRCPGSVTHSLISAQLSWLSYFSGICATGVHLSNNEDSLGQCYTSPHQVINVIFTAMLK